ncbi:hypothetical protein B0J17DRAFT_703392 [Rhizoctonia solani]|nr:hypothetical protein B0J17DRAFT_703392 [Rhizoctonia solani]
MLGRLILSFIPIAGTGSNSTAPVVTVSPYDYIVVGAGPSGIIVADHLSEAGKNVLLIERGGPSTTETGGADVPPWTSTTNLTRFDIPGLYESVFSAPSPYWWCDDVQTGAACIIGGGTAVNGLLYWYPTDAEWAISNGWPSGWQKPNIALKKVKVRLPSTDTPSTDGKRYQTQLYNVVKSILDKQSYSALTINENRNSKDHIYGHPNYYVGTAKARSNFKLMPNTKVLSLIRNGAQITGVRTNNTSINGNGTISLTSKGRVILSAGPFGTAKILFGSGIGPADQTVFIAADSTLSKYLPPSSQYINLPVDPVDKAVMMDAINDLVSTYKQVPNLELIAPDNRTSLDAHIPQVLHSPSHWMGSTKIGTSSSSSVVDTNTKGAIFVMAENAVAKILALSGGA